MARESSSSSSSFQYQLFIDGEPIERELAISAPGLSADMGSHFVQMRRSPNGFGMTLANCGMRDDGVVVIELDKALTMATDASMADVWYNIGQVAVGIGDLAPNPRRLPLGLASSAASRRSSPWRSSPWRSLGVPLNSWRSLGAFAVQVLLWPRQCLRRRQTSLDPAFRLKALHGISQSP